MLKQFVISVSILLLLQACKHPLEISGGGDIVDLNGSGFGCTLEQFQNEDPACLGNEVIAADYLVNYAPVARPGWKFVRWDGSCGHLSEGINCRFDAPAAFVNWFDENGVDTSSFRITAVFERDAYFVGGVIQGNSGAVELTLDNGETLSVADAVSFQFASELADQASYSVSVSIAPTGQSCSVANPAGVVAGADISDVLIECSDLPFYDVSTDVLGLDTPDLITVIVNGNSFNVGNGTFITPLIEGSVLDIALQDIPEPTVCEVTGDLLTPLAAARTLTISCSQKVFSVGGTVQGHLGDVIVSLNGDDTLAVTPQDDSFSFGSFGYGTQVEVMVSQAPPTQHCSVGANQTDSLLADLGAVIICSDLPSYEITTTIAGLQGDAQIDLLINGSVTSSGDGDIVETLLLGSSFNLVTDHIPDGYDCTVEGDASSPATADRSIFVLCQIRVYPVTLSVTGLDADVVLPLQINGVDIDLDANAFEVLVNHGDALTVSGTISTLYSCPEFDAGIASVIAAQDYNISCSEILYNISGKVLGLPDPAGLTITMTIDDVTVQAITSESGSFVFSDLTRPGDDVLIAISDALPQGYGCAYPLSIPNVQSNLIRQDIDCGTTATVDVVVDRIDPSSSFEVSLSHGDKVETLTVGPDDSHVSFTDIRQNASFELAITAEPDHPALCIASNRIGVVGTGSTVDIECQVVIGRMGMEEELEACVSENGTHTYLQQISEFIACDARQIASLQGIEFLASSALRTLDLSSNLVDNDETIHLQALVQLDSLILDDNPAITSSAALIDLEAALPSTLISLSNIAVGQIEYLTLDLGFSTAVLALTEDFGTVGFGTDYWGNDSDSPVKLVRSFGTPITRRFETTSNNPDSHAINYVVDLSGLDASISCDPSVALVDDEVVVSVSCDLDDDPPDISGTLSGVLLEGGLELTVYGDNAPMRFDPDYDFDYLIVGQVQLAGIGESYTVHNIPPGEFMVVPNTNIDSSCIVTGDSGVLSEDRANVDIECTTTIAGLVPPDENTGLYDCLSLHEEGHRLIYAAEVNAQLDCRDHAISSLAGIENFQQIEVFMLDDNDLADDDFDDASDPIYQLANLTSLSIDRNYSIRLTSTLDTMDTLLPSTDIAKSLLNAAGPDRNLAVEVSFSAEAEAFFTHFGEAVLEGVTVRGLETDTLDNQSDLLTMNGDSASFYPVLDGSDAFLNFSQVRPGLQCQEIEVAVISDIDATATCELGVLSDISVSLFGGGFDAKGRESAVVSGLELVYQETWPHNDIYHSKAIDSLTFADVFYDQFPSGEMVSVQPGLNLGQFQAPEAVYCDATAATSISNQQEFFIPCAQSTIFGSSTSHNLPDTLFASNQVFYALRILDSDTVNLRVQSSTSSRVQVVTGETATALTPGDNTQRQTLLDLALPANVEQSNQLTLVADTYILAIQNLNDDFIGQFEINLTNSFDQPSASHTMRPILLTDILVNNWFSSFGVFNGGELSNPRHTLTILSSDGGTGVASGAAVRIDLESASIDTFLILIDSEETIVALNDDSSDSGSNSTLLVQLKPGTYDIVAATFADGQTGIYSVSVASSMPALTLLGN